MNIEQYNASMSQKITWMVIISIVIAACVGFLICFLREAIKKKDGDGKIAIVAVLIVAMVGLTLAAVHMIRLSIDKKNESYIVYSGDYEVVSQAGFRLSAVQINLIAEGKTITFEEGTSSRLYEGSHHGFIVYSERTKVIVGWYCDLNHEEGHNLR